MSDNSLCQSSFDPPTRLLAKPNQCGIHWKCEINMFEVLLSIRKDNVSSSTPNELTFGIYPDLLREL